jgi:hypothetical protein
VLYDSLNVTLLLVKALLAPRFDALGESDAEKQKEALHKASKVIL